LKAKAAEVSNGRYILPVIQFRAEGYLPVATDKSHARIIWDCAWAHEGDVFATASRDKTVSCESIPSNSPLQQHHRSNYGKPFRAQK
jgi:hypothetical protein